MIDFSLLRMDEVKDDILSGQKKSKSGLNTPSHTVFTNFL